MCFSSPNIPAPQPPQEQKLPDTLNLKKRNSRAVGMGGGTVLTGSSGVAPSSVSTGGSTLLGG